MNDDRWYFAYGSNLFIDQKEERTGRIRQAARCRLPGYRFAFNKRGTGEKVYANITPDRAGEVWGVVYLCNPAALREMDRYEGVASGHYERVAVRVKNDSGELVEAITYVAGEDFECEPSRPTADYLRKIITGARYHALPKEYIDYVESLAK